MTQSLSVSLDVLYEKIIAVDNANKQAELAVQALMQEMEKVDHAEIIMLTKKIFGEDCKVEVKIHQDPELFDVKFCIEVGHKNKDGIEDPVVLGNDTATIIKHQSELIQAIRNIPNIPYILYVVSPYFI